MIQQTLEHALHFMKLAVGTRHFTVQEMAEAIGCSKRSVYRQIETFRNQGFIIKTDNGFVRMDKLTPYFQDIADMVSFSIPEVTTIIMALNGIHDNNTLKPQLIRKISPYDYKTYADIVVREKNTEIINRLSQAIEKQQQVLLMDYHSSNSKDVRTRLVEPFQFSTNFIQVWAYEPESESNKLFKIARISNVKMLNNPWRFNEKHQADKMDIFRMSSPQQMRVKLRLGMLSANLLKEEYPLCEKDLKQINTNEWILDTQVCSYEGVGRFVIGLFYDIDILETRHFQSFIKKRVMAYQKKLRVTKDGTIRK
ncbi:MAG: helix-turn-helix transcriptional regulator [Microbacter sp.]